MSKGPYWCDECGGPSDPYSGIGIGGKWYCNYCLAGMKDIYKEHKPPTNASDVREAVQGEA